MTIVALKITAPPGSISLDKLLRYLITIGRRRYGLSLQDSKYYALEALRSALERYGTKDSCYDEVWDRFLLGDACADIYLTQDTEEGRSYQASSNDTTILLKTESDAIRFAMASIFRSVVWKEEFRSDHRFRSVVWKEEFRSDHRARKLGKKLQAENRPSQRRGNAGSEGGADSLEEYSRNVTMERDEAEKAEVWFIAQKALEKMRADHASVVESLIAGESPDEVAQSHGIKVGNVYAIRRQFRKRCQIIRARIKARGKPLRD